MSDPTQPDEAVLPLHIEEVAIGTRRIHGETVRVVTRTSRREQVVEVPIKREIVEVERITVGQVVETAPPIRYEGDVVIVPVLEEVEVVVVERRLILKEELHVRRRVITETHRETVSLRDQSTLVTRFTAGQDMSAPSASAVANQLVSINNREKIMSQTIAAVYKSQPQAESAVQDLLDAGVSASSIDHHTQGGSYLGNSSSLATRPKESKGFWASLFGGESYDDTRAYDENLTAGGSVVTVRAVPDTDYDRVAAILDHHDPIDLDDHIGRNGGTETARTDTYDVVTTAPGPGVTGTTSEDEALSLSEESLTVGKRTVNRGSTRIRRYVVENAVEENVALRDEKVMVERRPVTAGGTLSDTAFTDKVIEMTETGEEVVVGKTARVVEEVVLSKEAVDRVETVRDSVRKEEVEIQTTPGGDLPADQLAKPIPKT